MNDEIEYRKGCLEDLKVDMDDDYRSWQEAEEGIKDAKTWRDKMALNYAESTVKYYNYKNNQE